MTMVPVSTMPPLHRRVDVGGELEGVVPGRQQALVDVDQARWQRQPGQVGIPDEQPQTRCDDDAQREPSGVTRPKHEPGRSREDDECQQRQLVGADLELDLVLVAQEHDRHATMASSVAPTVTTMPPMGSSASRASVRPSPAARRPGMHLVRWTERARRRNARHTCHAMRCRRRRARRARPATGWTATTWRLTAAARLAAGVDGLGVGGDAQWLSQQPQDGRPDHAQGRPDARDEPREPAPGRATAPRAGTPAPGR